MCKTPKNDPLETPPPAGKTAPAFYCAMVLLMIVVAVAALTGCQSGWDSPSFNVPPASPAPSATPEAGLYSTNILHEGDVVDITFQYSTNYNALQRIALDGTLNLNSVGPVKAAGKTVFELQQDVAKAYKSLAKDDVITVNLMMNSVAIVYVSVAVLKPGEVNLDHPLTAIEAIMAAGGFDNTRAKLSDVSVLRLENGEEHAYHVNIKRVLEGKENTPFYLKPFDIIYVPAKIFNY